jgi:hypothetical protein
MPISLTCILLAMACGGSERQTPDIFTVGKKLKTVRAPASASCDEQRRQDLAENG